MSKLVPLIAIVRSHPTTYVSLMYNQVRHATPLVMVINRSEECLQFYLAPLHYAIIQPFHDYEKDKNGETKLDSTEKS